MNLGNLIENAVKQIEIDKIKEQEGLAEAASDEELLEMELFADSPEDNMMTEKDYEEFQEFQENIELENNKVIEQLLNGEV